MSRTMLLQWPILQLPITSSVVAGFILPAADGTLVIHVTEAFNFHLPETRSRETRNSVFTSMVQNGTS